MKKKIVKFEDSEIISIHKKISQYIYDWLCNENGKYNFYNPLRTFLSILSQIGIKGKLIFTDFEEGKFKIISDNEQYEVRFEFTDGIDSGSKIIITQHNVSNSYLYIGSTNECKLNKTVKTYDNIMLVSYYSEFSTSYYIYTRQLEINLCLYEHNIDRIKSTELIEKKLISIQDFTKIESIISFIFSVYKKDVILSFEKISVEIKKLSFQVDSNEKKKTLLSSMSMSYGKLTSAFERNRQFSVSIDLVKDNLEYCDEDSKVILHNNSDNTNVEFNKDASENDIIVTKIFAVKKTNALIWKYSNIIAKNFSQ